MREFHDKNFCKAFEIFMNDCKEEDFCFFRGPGVADLMKSKPNKFRELCFVEFWSGQYCQIIEYFRLAEKIFNLGVFMGCPEAALTVHLAFRGFFPGIKEKCPDDVLNFDMIARTECVDNDVLLAALRSEAAARCRLLLPEKYLEKALVRAYR
jgi:hypothetical protein